MKAQNRLIKALFPVGIVLVLATPSQLIVGEIIDEDAPLAPPAKPPSPPDEMKSTSGSLAPVKGAPKESPRKKAPPKEPLGKPPSGPKATPPTKPSASEPKEKLPVHFSSQGLKGLREKGLVELVQEVVVTQGDFKLEAENAQVYFSEHSRDVQKVLAVGQPVKITNIDPNTGERIEAFGNQVLFNNEDRLVLLEGNAKIKKGQNSTIKGKKITYELDSGWIKADRVAGEVSPSP
jgi:lipopolysaccharide transport protein LptA